jgi:hypothetical protein
MLFFFLNLNPHQQNKSFRQHVAEFDFFGLLLLVGGVVSLLCGFNFSENGCEMLWLAHVSVGLMAGLLRNRG